MAEEKNLEDMVKDKPSDSGHPKEDPKPKSVIGSFIGELGDLVNLGIGIAAPAAGFALTGNAGVLATSAAFIAGTKGKKDSKIIRNESLSGAVFGAFAHYTRGPVEYLDTKLKKLAYMVPWVIGANAFYMAEDHLVKEKTPKGLGKKFKENYLKMTKKAFMLPAPINILSALFLPQAYFLYTLSAAAFLFRRFVAGHKSEEYDNKTPMIAAGSSVIRKGISNSAKGIYEAVSAIGSSLGDLYKLTPKAAAAPAIHPA
jgi:hypothetical protein